MLISELIVELEKLKEEHGDVQCTYHGGCESTEFIVENIEYTGKNFNEVEQIVIY